MAVDLKILTEKPGRDVCGIHCCCWQFCIWFISFPYLLSFTFLANPWQRSPGNEIRKAVHDDALRALTSNQWEDVKEKYEDAQAFGSSSLLMIGHGNTGLKWTEEAGRERGEKYPMGSQTKILTALTIYKMMQDSGGTFSPRTLVHTLVPGWPTTGFAGQVEMKHLMSMTTGFHVDVFKPGCVAELSPDTDEVTPQVKWALCMAEIGSYEFRYKPGSVFDFGPWHLYVAVGAALNAVGQPLTKEAWINEMTSRLLVPNGLTSRAEFVEGTEIPDVNHGIRLSANEWEKITWSLMNDQILTGSHKHLFLYDHTVEVDKVWADSPTFELWAWREIRADQALTGGWHYAQGHWITCNALTTKDAQEKYIEGERYTWKQQNRLCGYGTQQSQRARHDVHHSVGEHGAFIWMDFTHNYYGIFVQYFNWPVWLFWGSFFLLFASVSCCAVSCCIGAMVNSKKKNAS